MTLPTLLLSVFISADPPEKPAETPTVTPTETPSESPGTKDNPAPKTSGSGLADPNKLYTTYEYIGEVTGTMDKVDKNTLHLKVPETVIKANQNRHPTSTNRNTHHHSTAALHAPKLGTKMVDQNYQLSDNVVVKSIAGNTGAMSDVKHGETIRIHIVKVSQGKPGEKMEHHYEIKSIDVATVNNTGTTPTTPAAPAKKK